MNPLLLWPQVEVPCIMPGCSSSLRGWRQLFETLVVYICGLLWYPLTLECEGEKTGIFCSVSQPANNGRLDKFQTLKEFRQVPLKIGKVCGQKFTVGGCGLEKYLPGWHNQVQNVRISARATAPVQGTPFSFLSVVYMVSECDAGPDS